MSNDYQIYVMAYMCMYMYVHNRMLPRLRTLSLLASRPPSFVAFVRSFGLAWHGVFFLECRSVGSRRWRGCRAEVSQGRRVTHVVESTRVETSRASSVCFSEKM